MKRLAKVEHAIEELLKKQAKRYNKPYPGEMVRFNTKRLPLLQNQKATDPRDYLFTAIVIRINNAVKLNLFPDNRQ